MHNNLLTEHPLIYHYPFTHPFINIIFQSYNEKDDARRKELEYCILANLNNPYIAFIHDYNNTNKYLSESITQHPKYVLCNIEDTITNKWITYKNAFEYSSNINIINKYGSYWGLINCDIFLDNNSNWCLIRGKLNSNYIFAQSRHEFNFVKDNKDTNTTQLTLDINFDKLLHSTTQDGWFYKAPLNLHIPVDFELGMLGCDNAIADRLHKCGYNVINQPETFKICHYDISRGKNSNNFLAIHSQQQDKQQDKQQDHHQDTQQDHHSDNIKPQNQHPEREGCYLVPNYDKLLGTNKNINLVSIINSLGGISNDEIYKVICDLFSARILINNP